MSLVNKTLPNLFNGVSQQPPVVRLDSQCELQENALTTIVDGLMKRPPTEWIANLSSNADLSALVHSINRDVFERYIVIITNDTAEPIEVYTLNGTKCTVQYKVSGEGGSTSFYTMYDDNGFEINPRDDLKAVTVADHTIIVNTKRTIEMKDITPQTEKPTALVYVKRGIVSADYKVEVSIGGSVVATSTYSSSDNTTPDTYKTNAIAQALRDDLNNKLVGNWTLTMYGSTFMIENDDLTDFSVKVSDSYGNLAMLAIKNSVQKFTDLPPEAKDGLVLTVEGDPDNSFDNFYVRYRQSESGSGVWEETVKTGLQNEFKSWKMPHKLVRIASNTFELSEITWEKRLVGDENSNPTPSFVNSRINDVFFFKNRLGLLSGENVILSKAGDFFNCWSATATNVLDDDPIDIAVGTTRVAILNHAVPFANALLLFSDQQQFSLHAAASLLTPSTISVDTSTAFETSLKCTPVGAGSNVYFVVPNGDNSTIREYFVQPTSQTNDAQDITAHVPRYLPKNLSVLASSSARDILFALSPDEPQTIYTYKYYWNGEEKVQSAWSKWTFDDEIINIAVLENWLYMVTKKENEIDLMKINLEKYNAAHLDFRVHLDKQVSITGTYNSGTDTTTWTLPYYDSDMNFTVVEGANGNQVLNASKPTNNTIQASGDYSDRVCHLGKNYTMRYRFSTWYLRDRNGVANTQGRLQVRTLTLAFNDTGYFTLEGTPLRRETVTHSFNSGYSYEESLPISGGNFGVTYTGTTVGVSTLGKPSIISGEKRFFIMSNATSTRIDLVNNSYLPCQIQSASFEGLWTSRSRAYR